MKKKARFKLDDIKSSKVALINKHILSENRVPEKKKAKYNSVKVEFEGEIFDSKKELRRYKELQLHLKAGAIKELKRQVPYELNEGGSHSLKYYADFVYIRVDTGEEIVEDAKGFKTREYIKKKRLMKKIHNITIYEV